MSEVILELTSPMDTAVWIALPILKMMPSQDHPGGSLLWTEAGTQEVQESPDQILKMLDGMTIKMRKLHIRMQLALKK